MYRHFCIKLNKFNILPVLWIRIRMDPELLPGSGSVIIVPDPDPAKYERTDKKKCYFSLNSKYTGTRYLNNMGWIRIRIYPKLLAGSGSGINHSGSTTLHSGDALKSRRPFVVAPVCRRNLFTTWTDFLYS